MQAQRIDALRPPGVRPRVFISYRREDSRHVAGRLADQLNPSFDLFMDVEDIAPGTDYTQALRQAVSESEVLIALIGPQWAKVRDGAGRRRIDDPADWVANEIYAGLSRQIRVIPVLVDDARMPAAADLPPMLSGLASRQALSLRHESFADDCDRLIRAISDSLDQSVSPPIPAQLSSRPPRRGLPSVLVAILALALVTSAVAIGLALLGPFSEPNDDPTTASPTRSSTRATTRATDRATTRAPSPTRNRTTQAAEPTQRLTVGAAARFPNFNITVVSVTADPVYGTLVEIEVCLVRETDSDGTSRISWDPWKLTDSAGRTHRPTLATGTADPPGMFPRADRYPVGACPRGVVPFMGAPGDRVVSVGYSNSLGNRAVWTR